MATQRPEHVAEATSREHQTLVQALRALEDALASPATGREVVWKRRVSRNLAVVVGSLQDHCESAEGPGGLIVQVQRSIGRPHELSEAMREHQILARDAVDFLAALADHVEDERPAVADVRQRAAGLSNALRQHQAREADLLMQAMQRDIGVGD